MNLVKGLSEKTIAAGNISFGLRQTNILKANIHWDQDFRRISRIPSKIGISTAAKFRAEIEAAIQRARIKNHSLEESSSLRKAANPGNIKWHKDWITWYRALNNYLLTIIGQDGVPLRYVIKESAEPDYTMESQTDYDFYLLFIDCMSLTGLTYKKYSRKVNQLIHGFVQDETAEKWIKTKKRKQDV